MKATTEFSDITVFGARGFTLTILRGMEDHWQGRVRVKALIDDIDNGFLHPELGIPIISSAERLRDYADLPVLLTAGSGPVRAKAAARFASEEAILATASCVGPHHVDPAVDYGAGCLCAPYTRLGPNVVIGAGTHVLATNVAHDVRIGAFGNVGFNASILGHVIVGDNVNIAPHAIIANGTREKPRHIGNGATIGVGAVVIRDVPDGAHVVGNPALPIRQWARLSQQAEGA